MRNVLVILWFLSVVIISCGKQGVGDQRCSEISINGGAKTAFCYRVVQGEAIVQGDIVLGPEEKLFSSWRGALASNAAEFKMRYWANGIVPYTVDAGFPDPSRINAAISHYQSKTNIRLVPRTSEADYVTFRFSPQNVCNSYIGRVGKQQIINLGADCYTPQAIHEIGHAIGLWHEQGRSDRDSHVKIHWENITPGLESNFYQNLSFTKDWGPYDFHSIMHYPPYGFSKNGAPTLTRLNGSVDFGEQTGLTDGDVNGIASLYGAAPEPLNLVGMEHVIAAAPALGAGIVQVWNASNLQSAGTVNPFPGFNGGISMAFGDINGDGVLDLIAGAGYGGGPRVTIFDGRNGQSIRDFFPYDSSFRGGVFVASGDVNGDGFHDVITGTGVGGGPHVAIFDGRTGGSLGGFFAYESSFRGGVLVAAGDFNGDRRSEIVTGTGRGGGPRTRAFSFAGLVPYFDFFAYESSFRGGVMVSAGDIDGDGRDDLITGTGVGGGPRVSARSGSNLNTVIANFFSGDPNSRSGVNVAVSKIGTTPVIVSGPGMGGSSAISVHDSRGNLMWQYSIPGAYGVNVAGK